MEQEEHGSKKETGPLYYIEQPAFTSFSGPGQTVSIKKNAGTGKRRKNGVRKNNRSKKAEEEKKNDDPPDEEEIPENLLEAESDSSEQTVRDLLHYIETLPHFLHPVVACETNEQYFHGDILDSTKEQITFRDRRSFEENVIPVKDIVHMRIISL
ncbi:hypothetical protein [Salibacterium lacus]|uniref:Spore coat protein CotO n=1 Tax=Salibacterium lacus TaxID=1898109 RepID=A0ABW5SZ98_9BACI